VGCEVQTDTGRVLGRLTSVLRNSANDVYIIGQGKGEILLPAIKQVVQKVNLGEKRIVVTLLPGLLPEDAEETR
jgi:16S rRNA processing protein RimM